MLTTADASGFIVEEIGDRHSLPGAVRVIIPRPPHHDHRTGVHAAIRAIRLTAGGCSPRWLRVPPWRTLHVLGSPSIRSQQSASMSIAGERAVDQGMLPGLPPARSLSFDAPTNEP